MKDSAFGKDENHFQGNTTILYFKKVLDKIENLC